MYRQPAKPVFPAQRMTSAPKSLAAPIGGWVTAQNLAASSPNSCIVLDNMRPTTKSIAVRGGNALHATVGEEPVESLMNYQGASASSMFAAMDGDIFDITSVADPEVPPTPVVTGQTSDYYAYVNFATSGAYFMEAVNGTDPLLLYDGTAFYPITDTAIRSLDYDAETGNFTEGLTVTGGTSGATGVIVRVADGGTTGTLYLNNVTGSFQDNETITDTSTGSATADGVDAAFLGAITGADTSTFSHVNVYRNRLYFVEKNSLVVHYLDVDSATGGASQLSLSGIFRKGGSVYFTCTWSSVSGSSSLEDYLVVVSTEGELAIFQGSFPGGTDWVLTGTAEGPRPLGINGWMKAGGDITILTERGWIAVSAIRMKDPAALSIDALSSAIEPDWSREAMARRSLPWEVAKWERKGYAYINCPVVSTATDPITFVKNLQTGAWSRYTGWDTRCLVIHNEQMYFGGNDGTIRTAEVTGYDMDMPYTGTMGMAWDHMGTPGFRKTVLQARGLFITATPFTFILSASTGFTSIFPAPPSVLPDTTPSSLWDIGLFDSAVWDAGQVQYPKTTFWQQIGMSGDIFSMQLQIPIGYADTPTAELIMIDFTSMQGGLTV